MVHITSTNIAILLNKSVEFKTICSALFSLFHLCRNILVVDIELYLYCIEDKYLRSYLRCKFYRPIGSSTKPHRTVPKILETVWYNCHANRSAPQCRQKNRSVLPLDLSISFFRYGAI